MSNVVLDLSWLSGDYEMNAVSHSVASKNHSVGIWVADFLNLVVWKWNPSHLSNLVVLLVGIKLNGRGSIVPMLNLRHFGSGAPSKQK